MEPRRQKKKTKKKKKKLTLKNKSNKTIAAETISRALMVNSDKFYAKQMANHYYILLKFKIQKTSLSKKNNGDT